MKRFFVSLAIILIFFSVKVKADEGMWLLPLLEKLNYETMKGMGLKLTPEQIYSINNSSLKDAIVIFGGGCTGEIISDDGLLITNHHCGYDEIQNHSTEEHNYLKDGFWAMTRDEELPNPDLSVTFLVSIKDVTDSILAACPNSLTEPEREKIIGSVAGRIEDNAVAGTNYKATVRPFFDGNRYFLFVYEEYTDVRLVGTPPSSIGNYGDETDNWMWPRHTGDFSMFRVYTGPDGKPADYSTENIPLKPRYHLPISLKGVEMGDFSMILGFPGRTSRFISSWGVEELQNVTNPIRIKIRGLRQDILKEDMLADEKIDIMYATKYARSSNYWKYSIGQNKGIKRLSVIETKKSEENKFDSWVKANDDREELYGSVLNDLQIAYTERKPHLNNLLLISEALRTVEIFSIAQNSIEISQLLALESSDPEVLKAKIEEFKAYVSEFYNEYNVSTDMKVARALIFEYMNSVPADQQPGFYSIINKKYKGDVNKFVDNLYSKSMFASKEKLLKFLDNPSYNVISKDIAFVAAVSINQKLKDENLALIQIKTKLDRARRLYTMGLLEMNPDRAYYPDANSTMRFTYGTVGDYSPADAVHYNYYTTLKGVMEKEDPSNPEFIVPEKLKELYKNGDYGRYGTDDYMPVCFTTNNDITGGNSGSPVLNGKGELIGLAFDGNWEAMSGDIIFEKDIQKTICVDIRYVLFIIDKFAGAGHLVNEMTIEN